MTSKPDYMMQTYIRCTQDALWTALRDPDQIGAYNFLTPNVTLTDGVYRYTAPDGAPILVARILEEDPKSRIEHTFEIQGPDAAPASRSVFLLSPEGDHMKLVIEHYDLFHPVVPGLGVDDGWARWAAGLKTFLETGEARRFAHTGADQ